MSDQIVCEKCGHAAGSCDDLDKIKSERIADLERQLAANQPFISAIKKWRNDFESDADERFIETISGLCLANEARKP